MGDRQGYRARLHIARGASLPARRAQDVVHIHGAEAQASARGEHR